MSTDIANVLGAGSGIDIKTLAQNLTDVEKKPRADAIQARIDKSEKRISGYGAVMFGLTQFKDAFAALNDRSDFSGATVRNSTPLAFEATAGAAASNDQHSVEVLDLAQGQISRSGNFSSDTTVLNNGTAFSLNITVGGQATAVSVSQTTPSGIVDAINTKSGVTGVSARLVNTGDPANPITIVLSGETGASNAFTVAQPAGATSVPGLSFTTQLQPATDARAVIDGITISRATNTVDDVIPGVTLELLARNTAGAGTLTIGRDTDPAKTKIETMVKAYNDLQDFLDTLGDPKSDDEEYGGVLENDSLLRYVREQARSMITGLSSTPSNSVTALRDIGIALDRNGRLQVDAVKFDVSLKARFDDIASMFTGNNENLPSTSTAARGLAGDAVVRLEAMMAKDGPILSRSEAASSQLADAQEDLTELEDRMATVYDRYIKQFSVMDGLVSQMNSLRESLKGQFENLANMYENK